MSYFDYVLCISAIALAHIIPAATLLVSLLRLNSATLWLLSYEGIWGTMGASSAQMFRKTKGLITILGVPAGVMGVSWLFWYFQISPMWYLVVTVISLFQIFMIARAVRLIS